MKQPELALHNTLEVGSCYGKCIHSNKYLDIIVLLFPMQVLFIHGGGEGDYRPSLLSAGGFVNLQY